MLCLPDAGIAQAMNAGHEEARGGWIERMEVMTTARLAPAALEAGVERMGLPHLAFGVETERTVDELMRRLQEDGFVVVDGPRRTGDGCYESVVLDPDGNRVGITAEG